MSASPGLRLAARRRLVPPPANDNAAPVLIRVGRIVALVFGVSAILWVTARLLAP